MSHKSEKRFSKVSSEDNAAFDVPTVDRDFSLIIFLPSCLSFVAIFSNRSLVTAILSLWNKRNSPKEGISCSGVRPEEKQGTKERKTGT